MSDLVERIIFARDSLNGLNISDYGIIRQARHTLADAANAIAAMEKDLHAYRETLSGLLGRARWYVADALDAHEHSDGRELLKEMDAALSASSGGGSAQEKPEAQHPAAEASEGVEVPDFLKRMTGELPPAPTPSFGEDDGREGRREGAEEDPDPSAKSEDGAEFGRLAEEVRGLLKQSVGGSDQKAQPPAPTEPDGGHDG